MKLNAETILYKKKVGDNILFCHPTEQTKKKS